MYVEKQLLIFHLPSCWISCSAKCLIRQVGISLSQLAFNGRIKCTRYVCSDLPLWQFIWYLSSLEGTKGNAMKICSDERDDRSISPFPLTEFEHRCLVTQGLRFNAFFNWKWHIFFLFFRFYNLIAERQTKLSIVSNRSSDREWQTYFSRALACSC